MLFDTNCSSIAAHGSGDIFLAFSTANEQAFARRGGVAPYDALGNGEIDAAEAGQLQLNAFEPIIAHSIFKSVSHLRNGCLTLAERCVQGITANRDVLRQVVENSIGIVTALNPYIGYAAATEVALEAHRSGRGRRWSMS